MRPFLLTIFEIRTVKFLGNYFGYLSSGMGIIGVSFAAVLSDEYQRLIAMFALILTLGFIVWRVWVYTKDRIEQKYPDGYATLSSFAKWTTFDGIISTYDQFRHIQIKQPVKTCFEQIYHWSGSISPKVSSSLQDCCGPEHIPGAEQKMVRLKFHRAKVYNEVEIIHTKMITDDTDGKAEPYLCQNVKHPVYLISFRVDLLHVGPAYFGKQAEVTRTNNSQGQNPLAEHVDYVPFDPVTKSFSWQKANPEPGYRYKIEWEKPPAQRAKPDRRRGKAKRAAQGAVLPQESAT